MTVKLILLKSGEDIICDISNYYSGDDSLIGYKLTKPCVVKIIESKDSNYNINMIPWMALSKDTVIPIPLDWVVTITEPIDQVKEMYEREVIQNGRDRD